MYQLLKHETKFYYPLTDNNGKSTTKHLNSLLSELSNQYGGTTVYNASGRWLDDSNVMYTDELLIISVFSESPFKDEDLNNYAQYILNKCKQISVSVEVSRGLRLYSHDTTFA